MSGILFFFVFALIHILFSLSFPASLSLSPFLTFPVFFSPLASQISVTHVFCLKIASDHHEHQYFFKK